MLLGLASDVSHSIYGHAPHSLMYEVSELSQRTPSHTRNCDTDTVSPDLTGLNILQLEPQPGEVILIP